MCGIMGFVSGGYDVDLPKWADNALLLDTVRGNHSTGAVFVTDGAANYYKRAVAGYDFIHLPTYKRIKDGHASVFIGHNRFATMGAVDDNNAHPFTYGDWIGVHNGSLKSGWRSYLGTQYDVDSEAIIANIAEHGLKPTLERLEGAYSLVLYNVKEGKLYFARNTERPMNLIFAKSKQMFYGSEAELVKAAMLRNRFHVGEEIQTEVGVIYSIDKSLKLVEEEKFEVKKQAPAPVTYQYGQGLSGGNRGTSRSASGTRSPVGANWPNGKKPYAAKEEVHCYFTTLEKWGNNKDKYKVVGFVDDDKFTPIVVSNITEYVGKVLTQAQEALKIEVTYGQHDLQGEPALVGVLSDLDQLEWSGGGEMKCDLCQGDVFGRAEMHTSDGKPICDTCCMENGWIVA